MMFDPTETRRLQRISGEQFARETAGSAGVQTQEDWRNGNTLRGQNELATGLAEQVRIGTDTASVQSADRIANLMVNALDRFYRLFEEKMRVEMAEISRQIALRNAAPGQ
jgi:hypothetical protein